MLLSILCGISPGFVLRLKLTTAGRLNLSSKMNTNMKSLYEEAVYALNGLQSNAITLQKSRMDRDVNADKNLSDTERHLNTLGIQAEDLDSLNIIHVAGTKGKGSTCAFTESILRKHGYKTGFYSSPHLVSVNERIRVNGLPLDKDLFAQYFWEVYTPIQQSLKDDEKMPPYFMFLTVMAFYIFKKEKIEAAVIEVGIGGLYDCTNFIRKPVCVGVTSLGIDHVHILGHTLAEIATQKAGIFKAGVPAFTVPQNEIAMKVLHKKAQEVGCPLKLAPPLEAYDQSFTLGVPGIVQKLNASLAVQLAGEWLKRQKSCNGFLDVESAKNENSSEIIGLSSLPVMMASPCDANFIYQEALESCVWPGRFQTIERSGITFYLDGAHTLQSMKHCVKWFEDVSQRQKTKMLSPVLRILLFNCTGERKAETLLDPLTAINFDIVMFTPNRLSVMKDSSSDQSNFMVDPEKEIQQCITNRELWCHQMRSLYENELIVASQINFSSASASEVKTHELHEDNTIIFCCLSNAVSCILQKPSPIECNCCDINGSFSQVLKSKSHIQVLVTGSLHLVGGVLSLIET